MVSIDDDVEAKSSSVSNVEQESKDEHRQRDGSSPDTPSIHISTRSLLYQRVIGQFGHGLVEDLMRRKPHYISDWTEVWNMKILSSTLFIFFTSVAPSITFALYMSESTKGELGAIEILLATGITGVLMSVCSGQPLVIVGVTGPITILTASIYELSQSLHVKFIPFYAWAQIWAAFFHLFLAAANACDLVCVVTRFSCETFGILIAIIYIYTGLEGISKFLAEDGSEIEFASALLQLILAFGTVLVAIFLGHAKSWTVFNDRVRTLISDYAATFAVLFFTVVPYLTGNRLEEPVPTLYIPREFATTSGRPWLVDFTDISVAGAFAAIIPGIIITILFFFDHNVSSLIAQSNDMKLTKGHAFHWDFFTLGLGVIATAVLGLPPTNGLIPQAPLHTKSLSERRRVYIPSSTVIISKSKYSSVSDNEDLHVGSTTSGKWSGKFEVVKVHEQRMTNLLQSVMCTIVAIQPFSIALRKIPTSVLYGLFLYLGISSFEDNQFALRIKMFFMESDAYLENAHDPDDEYSFAQILPWAVIAKFTWIQFFACIIIFGITFTPAGVIFPVLIAFLVILRLWVFPKVFTRKELDILDVNIVGNAAVLGDSTRIDDCKEISSECRQANDSDMFVEKHAGIIVVRMDDKSENRLEEIPEIEDNEIEGKQCQGHTTD